ncbi:MAG TPA: ribonuclease HI, partial [Deltaproteobacteria bacterium]|nr:ribonuclease HI [Deltaproteobacteria bacterium]
ANAVEKGWARRWRSMNWMRDKSHRAENADLWAELLDLAEERRVRFHWVRGHAGNRENERCDELARAAAQRRDLPDDPGYERQLLGAGTRLF